MVLNKPKKMKKLKISVVTVSYNCEDVIEDTIQSVTSQTYTNIEYIIIDGKSKDSTLDIVNRYKNQIDIIVSEPDKGIYDAMNKAINMASGDYIIFMNAGDIFYNNRIIEKVFSDKEIGKADIIYGSVAFDKKGKEIELKPLNLNEFWKGSRFCHQSAFISLNLHKEFLYDLKYKIAADFNFFNKMYNSGKDFHFIDFPFSKISMGGISDLGRIKLIQEYLAIVNKRSFNVYYYYGLNLLKAAVLSRGKILTYFLFNK